MHSGFLADPVVANGVSGTLCRVKYGLVLFFPYIHIFWIFSLIHISSLLVMPHCHACIMPSFFSSIPIADPIGKCIVAHSFWTFCHFTFPWVITACLLSHKEIDTINCCFTIYYPVVFVLPDLLIVFLYVCIPSVLSLNLHQRQAHGFPCISLGPTRSGLFNQCKEVSWEILMIQVTMNE